MADQARERYLLAAQSTFIRGVQDYVPADVVEAMQTVRLENADVFVRGTARRRPGLTEWKDYRSSAAGGLISVPQTPIILESVYMPGESPYLICVLNVDASTSAVVIDDGSPTGRIEASGPKFSHELSVVRIFDRVYFLEPGETPRYWKPGFKALREETGLANELMPVCTTALFFRGRAWAGYRDLLYFSNGLGTSVSSGEVTTTQFGWDRTFQAFRMETGQIVHVEPLRNFALVVFTHRGIESMEPDHCNILESVRNTISNETGCAAKHTVVQAGEDIFFMDQEGEIRSLKQTTLDESQGVTNVPLTQPIRSFVRNQTKNRIFTSTATLFQGFYIVAWPSHGSQFPNEIWVYSIRDKAWEGPFRYDHAEEIINTGGELGSEVLDGEINFRHFHGLTSHTFHADKERLYSLMNTKDSEGTVYKVFDGTTDDGDVYQFDMVTRAFSQQNPRTPKTWNHVEIEVRLLGDPEVTLAFSVEARVDEGTWVDLGTFTAAVTLGPENNTASVDLPFRLLPQSRQTLDVPLDALEPGRTCQVRVRNAVASPRFEILAMMVSAQEDNVDFAN